jgi:hypothetical protein
MLGASILALVAFFVMLPPVLVLPGRPAVTLDLVTLASSIWHAASSATCRAGMFSWLALDCRFAAIANLLAGPEIQHLLAVRLALVAASTVAAGWIAADRIGRATPKRDGLTHVDGRRLRQGVDAQQSLRRALAQIGVPDERSLWLVPHVQLARAAESYNILAIGTQGAGKTGLLRAWIEQLIAHGDRAVLHDVKGDVTAGLPVDRMILVAPHDRRSAAWDISRDITDRAAALEFATRSIKAAQGDSMWADGARALWADAIVALIKTKGRTWTLADLYALLTAPPLEFRKALVDTGASSAELIAFDEAGGVQRTSMSLLITLWVAALTTLKPLVDAWSDVPANRRFSLSEWLKEGRQLPKTIVIQKSAAYPELSALVGGLLVERLAGLVLSPAAVRNPEERVALVLDELAELGRLERLPNLLAVGRELGVVTIAAIQDLGQLVETYGETTARTLEARFGIKVVGRLTAGDTAKRIADDLIGDRKISYTEMRAVPGSAERMPETIRERHPVFAAERFETELGVRAERRDLLIRCLILGLGDPALLDVPFTSWPDLRPAHRPAVWMRQPPLVSVGQGDMADRNQGEPGSETASAS